MKMILCAALLVLPPVSAAQAAPQAASEAGAKPAGKAGGEGKKDDFDIGQMMAVFDKLFPAQPDPLPARLALSRVTAQAIFPDGTYAGLMDGVMDSFVDRIMNLSEADFGAKGKDSKPPSTTTLRQQALKDDPHFEERMRIMERVITDELGKMAKIFEPKLREGLARSMARRFDEKQLTEVNAFLATDSGRAFGGQSMAMWVDADVMRAMMGSLPELFAAMPAAMKRLEAETAHLPKPKKKDEPRKEPASRK